MTQVSNLLPNPYHCLSFRDDSNLVMPCEFGTLPFEVLNLTFQTLKTLDLKNLRKTCRSFCRYVDEKVFCIPQVRKLFQKSNLNKLPIPFSSDEKEIKIIHNSENKLLLLTSKGVIEVKKTFAERNSDFILKECINRFLYKYDMYLILETSNNCILIFHETNGLYSKIDIPSIIQEISFKNEIEKLDALKRSSIFKVSNIGSDRLLFFTFGGTAIKWDLKENKLISAVQIFNRTNGYITDSICNDKFLFILGKDKERGREDVNFIGLFVFDLETLVYDQCLPVSDAIFSELLIVNNKLIIFKKSSIRQGTLIYFENREESITFSFSLKDEVLYGRKLTLLGAHNELFFRSIATDKEVIFSSFDVIDGQTVSSVKVKYSNEEVSTLLSIERNFGSTCYSFDEYVSWLFDHVLIVYNPNTQVLSFFHIPSLYKFNTINILEVFEDFKSYKSFKVNNLFFQNNELFIDCYYDDDLKSLVDNVKKLILVFSEKSYTFKASTNTSISDTSVPKTIPVKENDSYSAEPPPALMPVLPVNSKDDVVPTQYAETVVPEQAAFDDAAKAVGHPSRNETEVLNEPNAAILESRNRLQSHTPPKDTLPLEVIDLVAPSQHSEAEVLDHKAITETAKKDVDVPKLEAEFEPIPFVANGALLTHLNNATIFKADSSAFNSETNYKILPRSAGTKNKDHLLPNAINPQIATRLVIDSTSKKPETKKKFPMCRVVVITSGASIALISAIVFAILTYVPNSSRLFHTLVSRNIMIVSATSFAIITLGGTIILRSRHNKLQKEDTKNTV